MSFDFAIALPMRPDEREALSRGDPGATLSGLRLQRLDVAMPQPGQILGSYRLIALLGQGGMGEVWRAEHVALGRPAAVKLMRHDICQGAASPLAMRFEREAQATARLSSPHTVDIHDFGPTPDGCFFYAMELLDGVDLDQMVRRFGPLPPARVVHLLRQACESLGEAHRQGLVHRDVKPANLFACRQGLTCDFVKVLDFGLVRAAVPDGQVGQLTSAGAITGSPAYLAPEQVMAGGTLDARTDVYALGGVGIWLLTGEVPFPAESSWEMVVAHLQRVPDRPSQRLGRAVPADLEAVLLDCLAKQPAQRPKDAAALAECLAACSCAGQWSAADASAWWQVNLPDPGPAAAPPGVSTPTAFGDTLDETPQSAPLAAAQVASPPPPPADLLRPAGPKPTGTAPKPSDEERSQVVARLRDHFAFSTIDLREYERRVEKAHAAADRAELDALVADLPSAPPAAPPQPAKATDQALLVPPSALPAVAIFSGIERYGRWTPARQERVVCVFGGAELDLTEAQLAPGCTHLQVVCVFGGAEITVPDDLRVEVVGAGIFGGFSDSVRGGRPVDDTRPWLRITGVAVFGGVDVRRAGDVGRRRKRRH